MLEQDRLKALSDQSCLLLDSEETKDVAVLSGDIMDLDGIVEVFTVLHELEVGFGMLFAVYKLETQEDGEEVEVGSHLDLGINLKWM